MSLAWLRVLTVTVLLLTAALAATQPTLSWSEQSSHPPESDQWEEQDEDLRDLEDIEDTAQANEATAAGTNPFRMGVFNGWCRQWNEGSSAGRGRGQSYFDALTEAACWTRCRADSRCMQAVFEGQSGGTGQCWLGLNRMTEAPTGWQRASCTGGCQTKCFGRSFRVTEFGLPETDYMEMIGADEAAGKRQAFLTENKMYYLTSGTLPDRGNETLGLTHPFYHDLRSRGSAIATYNGQRGTEAKVGTGNDFNGWPWYRGVKAAHGSIIDIASGHRWEDPQPTRMWWRPDKVIAEYQLQNPFVPHRAGGSYPGWPFGATLLSRSHPGQQAYWGWYTTLNASVCFARCDANAHCFTAAFERERTDNSSPANLARGGKNQCWLFSSRMTATPSGAMRSTRAVDTLYAKRINIQAVNVREEKFIAINEVVSTTITASRGVTLEVNGRSFSPEYKNGGNGMGRVARFNAACAHASGSNAIQVRERGRMFASVTGGYGRRARYIEGPFVLDGMTSVLTASVPMQNVRIGRYTEPWRDTGQPQAGVCNYTFQVPLNEAGVSLSYAIEEHAQYASTLSRAAAVVANVPSHRQRKTDKMNNLLNNVVPYFRCSDHDIVKVYYYLWSVNLMLYIDVGRGLESMPHTQSAANNFLGMHRFDGVFQIMAGAWTNPNHHAFWANGNALVWEGVYRARLSDELVRSSCGLQLPDNFGIAWGSGVFGPELIAHVIGACDIYEHSGNMTFVREAYRFYRAFFWGGICGTHWNYAYDAVLCLNKMAALVGQPEDASHWNVTVRPTMVQAPRMLERRFSQTPAKNSGTVFSWTRIAEMGVHAPGFINRSWVESWGREWVDDARDGFFDKIPPGRFPLQQYHRDDDANGRANCPLGPKEPACTGGVDFDFTNVPDGAWYTIRPFFLHKVGDIATKITLAHLKRYNMFHGFPVAPEAINLEGHEFGNQYNNFNAGKLLLYLEGLGGIRVSHTNDSFTYADSMPSNWTYMEFRVPVRKNGRTTWVKTRSERSQTGSRVTKTATVENSPYRHLYVQPWAETARVVANGGGSLSADHVDFEFSGQQQARVQVGLDYSSVIQDLTQWDGSLAAQGLRTKLRDMRACAVPNNASRRTYEPCTFQGGVWSRGSL